MWKKTLVVLSTFLFLFSMSVGNTEGLTWEEITGQDVLNKLLNEVVNLINRVNSMIEYIKNIPSQVVNAISGTFGLINARLTQIYTHLRRLPILIQTYLTGLPSLILEKIMLLPGYVIGVFIGLFGYIENMIYSLSDFIANRIPPSMVAFALPVAVALFFGTWFLIIALIPKLLDYIPFV